MLLCKRLLRNAVHDMLSQQVLFNHGELGSLHQDPDSVLRIEHVHPKSLRQKITEEFVRAVLGVGNRGGGNA